MDEKLKSLLGKTGQTCLAFVLFVLAGWLLLCVIYAIPNGRVSAHVRESGEILMKEDLYYQMIPDKGSTTLDDFTDAIMLLTAGYSREGGVIEKAACNYRTYVTGLSKAESCRNCGADLDPDMLERYEYGRYWHGYLLALKPALILFNLNEIRDINLFFILLLISATVVLLYRAGQTWCILPYLAAAAYLNPATIAASLQNSVVFYVTSVSVLFLLGFYRTDWFSEHLWIYFMLTGMLTSYMDFLTYPLVSLGFPLIFFFVIWDGGKLRECLARLVLYSGFWGAGYLGMWASKWLIATVVSGENYFLNAYEAILVRTGDRLQDTVITWNMAFKAIWGYVAGSGLAALIVLLLLVFLVLALRGGLIRERFWNTVMIFAVAAYPLAWILLARNHSYIHGIFTHRILSVTILGVLCGVGQLVRRRARKASRLP